MTSCPWQMDSPWTTTTIHLACSLPLLMGFQQRPSSQTQTSTVAGSVRAPERGCPVAEKRGTVVGVNLVGFAITVEGVRGIHQGELLDVPCKVFICSVYFKSCNQFKCVQRYHLIASCLKLVIVKLPCMICIIDVHICIFRTLTHGKHQTKCFSKVIALCSLCPESALVALGS